MQGPNINLLIKKFYEETSINGIYFNRGKYAGPQKFYLHFSMPESRLLRHKTNKQQQLTNI